MQELWGGQGGMAPTQDLQRTRPGEGGGKSCKRDAFLSPFHAQPVTGGVAHGRAVVLQKLFADTELIPNFHCLPAKFP